MHIIIKQITSCVYIFALMFVSIQAMQVYDVSADMRDTVLITPHDEENFKKIQKELGRISTNKNLLVNDLNDLQAATKRYKAALTQKNKIDLKEKTGKFLNTTWHTVYFTIESIEKVMPEISKFKEHYKKNINDLRDHGEISKYPGILRQLDELLNKIEKLMTYLDKTEGYLKEMSVEIRNVIKRYKAMKTTDLGIEMVKIGRHRRNIGDEMGDLLEGLTRGMAMSMDVINANKKAEDYFKEANLIPDDLDKKEMLYKMAILLRPDWACAHHNLGLVYEKQARYTKAIQEYKEAVKINPGHTKTYHCLGHIYEKQGSFVKAINTYTRAFKWRSEQFTY